MSCLVPAARTTRPHCPVVPVTTDERIHPKLTEAAHEPRQRGLMLLLLLANSSMLAVYTGVGSVLLPPQIAQIDPAGKSHRPGHRGRCEHGVRHRVQPDHRCPVGPHRPQEPVDPRRCARLARRAGVPRQRPHRPPRRHRMVSGAGDDERLPGRRHRRRTGPGSAGPPRHGLRPRRTGAADRRHPRRDDRLADGRPAAGRIPGARRGGGRCSTAARRVLPRRTAPGALAPCVTARAAGRLPVRPVPSRRPTTASMCRQ